MSKHIEGVKMNTVTVKLINGDIVNITDMLTCNGHILLLRTDKGITVLLSDIEEVF